MSSNLEVALALWGWGVYVGLYCAHKLGGIDLKAVVHAVLWPVFLLLWGGGLAVMAWWNLG